MPLPAATMFHSRPRPRPRIRLLSILSLLFICPPTIAAFFRPTLRYALPSSALPTPVASAPFPRNLHRVYDGTWEVAAGSGAPFGVIPVAREPLVDVKAEVPPFRTKAAAAAAINATPNEMAVDTANASRSLRDRLAEYRHAEADAQAALADVVTNALAFDNCAGFALLTAENHRSRLSPLVDVVFGELMLRDGPYRSPHDVSLRLMGVYDCAVGKLTVVGDVLYEDSGTALARLWVVFSAANGDDRLREMNVTRDAFVDILTPAFVKHRKQFRAQRPTVVGATSATGLAPIPRKPTIATHCPFEATISIVAGTFADSLPAVVGAVTHRLQSVTRRARERPVRIERERSTTVEEAPGSMLEDGPLSGTQEDLAVEMNGVYNAARCKTHLNIVLSTLDTQTLFGKAINYTLLVTFVAFFQVVVLIRQMELTSTQAGASRVSLMTVGLQAVADSYLCLGHLTLGIAVPTLFNAFATAAFFKFIIFSIFEMRWLLLIWKARRPSGFAEGWEAMRRELSLLYSRFYGSLLLGIVILYQLQNHLKYFVFALYAFWVPQILLNVVDDHRKPLHPLYILGMSSTRLMIPLYLYACPRNFLHVQPQYGTAIGLVVWITFQACVLLSQHKYGSRWFVPKPFLPVKYDYFRVVSTVGDEDGGEHADSSGDVYIAMHDETMALADEGRAVFPREVECCICMMPVDVLSRERMITPCQHMFHATCLEQWLNVKLECAVCRQTVPPC